MSGIIHWIIQIKKHVSKKWSCFGLGVGVSIIKIERVESGALNLLKPQHLSNFSSRQVNGFFVKIVKIKPMNDFSRYRFFMQSFSLTSVYGNMLTQTDDTLTCGSPLYSNSYI